MYQAKEELLRRDVPVSMVCFTTYICKQHLIPPCEVCGTQTGSLGQSGKTVGVLLLTLVALAKDLQRNASITVQMQ